MSIAGKIFAAQDELIQLSYHVSRDGLAGPQTWGALSHELGLGVDAVTAESLPHVVAAAQAVLTRRGLYHSGCDGIAGPETWDAVVQALGVDIAKLPHPSTLPPAPPSVQTAPGEVDDRSAHAIATLHKQVQPLAEQALVRFNEALLPLGLHAVITSATRTYAEQQDLYAQGRTAPGSRVTNAPAGWSNHNFGLAFDISIFRGSSPIWDSPLYRNTLAPIGKRLGFTWGGDWASINDEPHYELRPAWADGLSEGAMLAGLRERHDNGRDAFAA